MNKWDRVVQKAIARNKRSITYTKKATSNYTPGGTVSQTTVTYTTDAARATARVTVTNNGQMVIKDVTQYYIPAFGLLFEPKISETITDGSESFTITKVDKHYAGGTLVLYIVHC